MDEKDQKALENVLDDTAQCATQQVVQQEKDAVQWFRDQGVTVNKVDRKPFRDATVKLHNGPAATWSKETYDRLQAIH